MAGSHLHRWGPPSAPKIFNAIADLLQWIIIDQCHTFVIHYLDNFLLVGPPDTSQCANALERSLAICSWLGIPIAQENVEGPSTTLIFLRIELDSLSWEALFRKEKLSRIHSIVQEWQILQVVKSSSSSWGTSNVIDSESNV